MAVATLIVLDLFFYYWTVMSVEVFALLGYQQINFPLYYIVVFLAVLMNFRAFAYLDFSRSHRHWLTAIWVANRQLVILGLLFFAATFATKDQAISRLFVSTFLFGSWIVVLLLNRYLPELLVSRVFGGQNEIRLALVGERSAEIAVLPWLERTRQYGVSLKGWIDSTPPPRESAASEAAPLPVLGSVGELDRLIDSHRITHLLFMNRNGDDQWIQRAAGTCQEKGVRLWLYNLWGFYFTQPLMAETNEGHTFFTFVDEPLEDPVNRMLKRLFDVIVSLGVIAFVLAPLCVVVAIAQKFQAPGPLFFRQRRYGRQQEPFYVYKFRSMRVDDGSQEAKQATRHDDRIYPFGRFMRRTSLDEIPQFLNVLRSEMSVVGPRPHLDKHDEAFAQIIEFYKTRNYIKPGITGLAQTNGYRGEITDQEHLRQRIRHDIEYINSWSLWLDTWLVIKTALQVVRPPDSAR